jgi:hypothetical protein
MSDLDWADTFRLPYWNFINPIAAQGEEGLAADDGRWIFDVFVAGYFRGVAATHAPRA